MKKKEKSTKAFFQEELNYLHDEVAALQNKIHRLSVQAKAADGIDEEGELAVGDIVALCGGTKGRTGERVRVSSITKKSVWVTGKDGKCFLKRKENVVKVRVD